MQVFRAERRFGAFFSRHVRATSGWCFIHQLAISSWHLIARPKTPHTITPPTAARRRRPNVPAFPENQCPRVAPGTCRWKLSLIRKGGRRQSPLRGILILKFSITAASRTAGRRHGTARARARAARGPYRTSFGRTSYLLNLVGTYRYL
eukprot:SAG31_NODE_13178_length_887_cov_1.691624_1_plen_149_part_00